MVSFRPRGCQAGTRLREPTAYTRPVALDVEVQRLQIGDVVLVDLDDQDTKVEAKVVRAIDRTEGTVLATLRVVGRDDFVKEWRVDELVTLVRGP